MPVEILAFLAASLVMMIVFPQAPASRWLHNLLVEPAARFVADFTWSKFAMALLVGAASVILMLLAPEIALALGALDAAMLELLALATLTALSGDLASIWRTVRRVPRSLMQVAGRLARIGRARSPRQARKHRAGNHPARKQQAQKQQARKQQAPKADDEGPIWALA